MWLCSRHPLQVLYSIPLHSYSPLLLRLDALDNCEQAPSPEIKQMLLVLQSVHRSPPVQKYFQLLELVTKVVQPYLCMMSYKPPEEKGDAVFTEVKV